MIVDNQIIINITNKNKGYYISKGYSICGYGKYTVNVIDIPTHSHVIITVSCSVCGVIKQIKYCDYNKITTNNTTQNLIIEVLFFHVSLLSVPY